MMRPPDSGPSGPSAGGATLGEGERLIFVGGAPRSGTTLVQNVLDSHPDILGTPELLHLPDLLRVHSQFQDALDRGLLGFFVDEPSLDRATACFLDRLLGPTLAKTEARFLSEKTPSNALVFEQLRRFLPRARFVFVVRDPRANVSSMLRVGQRALAKGEGSPDYTLDVRAAIRAVRQHLKAGFAFARAAPDTCLTLRYEELASRPVETTRALCRFLDLPWEESMISPAGVKHAGEGDITRTGVWYDSHSFNRDPEAGRASAWTRELEPGYQVLVTRAFRGDDRLRQAGDELGLGHLTGGGRIRAMAEWATDGLGYRIRKPLQEGHRSARSERRP